MDSEQIRIHPAANIFPMMSPAEYAGLLENIREDGVHTVLQFRGDSWEQAELIDGRNRLKALQELGLAYRDHADLIATDDIPDPIKYVLSLNLHRRHLDTSQRSMVAANVATLLKGEHGSTVDSAKALAGTPITEAAKALNVSPDSVKRARTVKTKGTEELNTAVTSGEVSVTKAAKIAVLPQPEQAAEIEKAKAPKSKRAETLKPIEAEVIVAKPTKSQALGELKDIFDSVSTVDEQLIDRFVDWALNQSDILKVHEGCALWLSW
jgi:ParB-like chromosome segregation protein Spo0J